MAQLTPGPSRLRQRGHAGAFAPVERDERSWASEAALALDQNGLVLPKIILDHLFAGKGSRRPLGVTSKKLVMNQQFAHLIDLEIGVFDLPNLSLLQGLNGNSALLHISKTAMGSEYSIIVDVPPNSRPAFRGLSEAGASSPSS